jgi:hypothetical protein
MLTAPGWILQDYKTLNVSAAHLEEAGSRGTFSRIHGFAIGFKRALELLQYSP